MNLFFRISRTTLLVAIFGIFAAGVERSWAQTAGGEVAIVEFQGDVQISPAGKTIRTSAHTNQILRPFDRLRTGADSRVTLRWSDQSVVPFGASTELEILPPQTPDAQCGLHLIRGIISFFHRDKPGRIQIITRGAVAGVEGTEFVMAVNDADRTTLSVIDGRVRFGNEQATIILTNGQQAVAEFGKAPVRTAGFIANNILQWCFYYPAVLDLDDLPLTAEEQKNLADSFQAYRAGDLLAALAKYPATRQPESDAERIYYAALLLSVGQVEQAQSHLASTRNDERSQRLVAALRQLIAAVKRQPDSSNFKPQLATEFLAGSYYEQSRALRDASLEAALNLARQAAARSPQFGFAWERVAELEFSFGRTKDALAALDKSLALAPRNAQALALKGFLLAAQNRPREAVLWFDRALSVDSALGNAWLGRGLCRIRDGDADGGREDLLMAAALEPQRAELRSYLGKAYVNTDDFARANKELQIAKKLDPNDPTAWLYSALLDQQKNLINDAIGDLEKSEALNGNRSVYRSQLLLDKDQAVRSANLAAIYRDAGMFNLSLREAARAVSDDYGNYSAHLFLANSYSALLDPNEINLRYETPESAEYLLANLLAPAAAGPLSPIISQQEYSGLFARNQFGIVSSTEYLSRGAWTESGAQYGTFDDFSYALEAFYRSDPGQRINDDFLQRALSLTVRQQLTPQDNVYLQLQQNETDTGDVSEYYNSAMANPGLRIQDSSDPELTVGYHHQWSPGVDTLFLFNRLSQTYSVENPDAPELLVATTGNQITAVREFNVVQAVTNVQTVYSTELQQIWQQPEHTTIVGGKFQWGNFNEQDIEQHPSSFAGVFANPDIPAAQDLTIDFYRFSVYGYQNWQIFDPLLLVGGISYDQLNFPKNIFSTPFFGHSKTASQISPKAGLIWTPFQNTIFRAAYTRSLGGVDADESIRLEPTEVAGFNQAFRSIIPESVVGSAAGAQFETYDISLEQKFSTGTYLSLAGEILYSRAQQTDGGFALDITDTYAHPAGLNRHLDYRERSLIFTADQLLGKQWSAGARYRLTQANLDIDYPAVPNLPPGEIDPPFRARQSLDSVLHELNLHANWNHPSGLFAILEADWYWQSNAGFAPAEPGDTFWQFNALAGYRFLHRKAELEIGLLNITGQNYKLEPLTLYNEMPRSRTLTARFQFNF